MVTATDPDVTDEARLFYAITGGNDQQMFNIDSKNGSVPHSHPFKSWNNPLSTIRILENDVSHFAFILQNAARQERIVDVTIFHVQCKCSWVSNGNLITDRVL